MRLSEQERAVLVELCRPMLGSASSGPASNQEIGDEIYLATGAVETYLCRLADRFGAGELRHDQQRKRLAEIVLREGIIGPDDVVWVDTLKSSPGRPE